MAWVWLEADIVVGDEFEYEADDSFVLDGSPTVGGEVKIESEGSVELYATVSASEIELSSGDARRLNSGRA